MQFNAYSQHLILYSHPSLSILMAFSFQSLTNSLRKKKKALFPNRLLQSVSLLVYHDLGEVGRKNLGRLILSSKTCGMKGTFSFSSS